MSDFDWTDAPIAQLRALWDEGHSAAEIGRRMGVSKNAVHGKAHRLALPARPSPIRHGAAPVARAPKPARAPARTLPALPPAPTVVTPVIVPPPRPALYRGATCLWPIGEPGSKDFRFCDATDVVPARPYCAEHCRRAFIRVAALQRSAA